MFRQGCKPVSSSSRVTTGVKLTNSQTVSTKNGFASALKAAVTAGASGFPSGVESTQKISALISSCVSRSQESAWSQESTKTFTVPAGKRIVVVQTVLQFTSPYSKDNCSLYTHESVEISS